jgi:hypothetical protein
MGFGVGGFVKVAVNLGRQAVFKRCDEIETA